MWEPGGPAYLAVGAVGLVVAFFALAWVVAPRRTDRSLIPARGLRRLWRWYRSEWARLIANVVAWPHLVDVLFGTRRATVGASPADVVWQQERSVLYRFRGSRTRPVPILIVHSLISKPWILDLTPERSLIRALTEEGFDVFLLDWGEFERGDAGYGLSHFAQVVMGAEREVLKASGRSQLELVGYCLGGTLSLARVAARSHDHIRSLTLIAAPVDLATPTPLQTILTHRLLKPVFFLNGSSSVPGELVRESFHLLRPQAVRTVITLVKRRRDREFRNNYAALARWVWEHRVLPGTLFFDLVDLFRTNALFESRLEVAGELARLGDVKIPVGVFVAERDHIVPSGSSHAITSIGGLKVELFSAPSGHVSMVCGSHARESTWPRLIEWLAT